MFCSLLGCRQQSEVCYDPGTRVPSVGQKGGGQQTGLLDMPMTRAVTPPLPRLLRCNISLIIVYLLLTMSKFY